MHPELVDEFLGGGEETQDGAVLLSGGLGFDTGQRTVLITGIVGSTGMTQRLGDAGAMTLVDEHDAIVRFAVREAGGREVKHTGDGIMAAFVLPSAAVRCAIRVQQALALRNAAMPQRHSCRSRCASARPRASRWSATTTSSGRPCNWLHASVRTAQPQEVLVAADTARDAAADGVAFDDVPDISLKGFEHPQHLKRVRWLGASRPGP